MLLRSDLRYGSIAQSARRWLRATTVNRNDFELPPPPSSFPSYTERPFFRFELLHQSKISRARVGRITTPHGSFLTPSFVAVATNAALKAACHRELEDSLPLVFCNTYHLMLHPGPRVVEKAGGLHQFMKRSRPIITDSGGFQVFSLAHGSVEEELNMKKKRRRNESSLLVNVSEEGATFRSYRDGTLMTLTPESSVKAQKAFGADIIIPLDELPPYHIKHNDLYRSMLLSHRWEARSLATHLDDIRQQAMYCVLHGGINTELRQMSIDYLSKLPFDGIAIGGSLGKNKDELIELLSFVMPRIPYEKPNHLLGIADVESISRSVPLGVDTFDSCFPTRLGRHGTLLTERFGKVHIRKKKWKDMFETPNLMRDDDDKDSEHTMAYLHHLFKQNEPMAGTLLTSLNIMFMAKFMGRIRAAIFNNEL